MPTIMRQVRCVPEARDAMLLAMDAGAKPVLDPWGRGGQRASCLEMARTQIGGAIGAAAQDM